MNTAKVHSALVCVEMAFRENLNDLTFENVLNRAISFSPKLDITKEEIAQVLQCTNLMMLKRLVEESKPYTPGEFSAKMFEFEAKYKDDPETKRIHMENLILGVLIQLGFGNGARTWQLAKKY